MKTANYLGVMTALVALSLMAGGCSTDRAKNRAKAAAAQYWQDKAYPGRAHDVQVIEAAETDDGRWRVRGIVDKETRVGVYNPESETFDPGFYSLAKERDKKIAELEQKVQYWKDQSNRLEKQNFKLKVQLDQLKKTSTN